MLHTHYDDMPASLQLRSVGGFTYRITNSAAFVASRLHILPGQHDAAGMRRAASVSTASGHCAPAHGRHTFVPSLPTFGSDTGVGRPPHGSGCWTVG